MPPRTRQRTGNLPGPPATLKRKASVDEPDLDLDFKALSRSQRRKIDETFQSALGASKRRKTDSSHHDGGGFMPDSSTEGGFMPDEMGGGGFMPEPDEMMMGGGFMTERMDEPIAQPTSHLYDVPSDGVLFSSLPELLQVLGLPWDEDVQAAFDGVCEGTTAEGARYATKGDFRSVCAAMMEPEPEEEGQEQEEEDQAIISEDSSVEDAYTEPGQDAEMDQDSDSSSLSDEDVDMEADDRKTQGKRKSRSKPRAGKGNNQDLRLDPTAQVKLSREQREWITMMWNTMFEGTQPSIIKQHGPKVLGKDEIKRWAVLMDLSWSDTEVAEMIEVFSTIPGKRGLSYDDFTTILLRAGLVQF